MLVTFVLQKGFALLHTKLFQVPEVTMTTTVTSFPGHPQILSGSHGDDKSESGLGMKLLCQLVQSKFSWSVGLLSEGKSQGSAFSVHIE